MNVFKIFNNRNFLNTCQQASALISRLRISPLELRQYSSFQNVPSSLAVNYLSSFIPLVMSLRGMKTKGHLQLRCKNCYFERKDGEMYVFCTSYGRHKQHLRKKMNKKFNWILSYVQVCKGHSQKWHNHIHNCLREKSSA